MTDLLTQFPGVGAYLDDSESFENSARVVVAQDSSKYLVVTQAGETVSGDLVFGLADDGTLTFLGGDTEFDFGAPMRPKAVIRGNYVPSGAVDHEHVAKMMVEQAGKFSSASGPGHGNLACVWAMRKIAQMALGREITRTDFTNTLVDELAAGFNKSEGFAQSEVPAGGIIISPGAVTTSGKWRHGHVGLMADPDANGVRIVYSNSSRKAQWIKNGTSQSWLQDHSGLKTYYFPIPVTA